MLEGAEIIVVLGTVEENTKQWKLQLGILLLEQFVLLYCH